MISAIKHRLTNGSMDLQDIEIKDAEYSDDDEKIPFKEKELIEYLFRLEETNLFDINQLQNDSEQLETLKKSSEETLTQLRKKVQEIDDSIK
jgi:hypothetical protein